MARTSSRGDTLRPPATVHSLPLVRENQHEEHLRYLNQWLSTCLSYISLTIGIWVFMIYDAKARLKMGDVPQFQPDCDAALVLQYTSVFVTLDRVAKAF